jgi:hypothetical protein
MTDVFTKKMIDELEDMANDVALPFEKRLIQTAVWFHRNKDRIPRENVPQRLDFLEKTMDIMLELMALSLDRMQNVENRRKSSILWTARGMDVHGDVTKFD